MAVSATYVVGEAASNLWRNRLMTIAAVLTAAVSLALVGSTLLLKQGASHATVRWQQGVNVIVWVKPTATPAQTTEIKQALAQNPYVVSCAYKTQAYDYNEARDLLAADEFQSLDLQSMPSSYRCSLNDPLQATEITDQFQTNPAVSLVSSPTQQIRTMEGVIRVLQWVFLALAVVLLLSATVLILNTIRMAIYARRREVSVMKLVGATNWFIRLPFMAEGLVQGFLGSAVAVVAVLGLYFGLGLNVVKTASNQNSLIAQMAMGGWEVAMTCLVVVVVGVAVGVVGSAVAVSRFLDV